MYLPMDARDAPFKGVVTSAGVRFELKMDGSLRDLSWSILLALLDQDDPVNDGPSKAESGPPKAEQIDQQLVLFKMMRHDLRNKMVTVRGALDVYRKCKDEKFMEKAMRNLEACDEMVSRMSLLYRSMESPGKLRPVDLKQMADSVVCNYQDSGVEMVSIGSGFAQADEAMVHVIDNLVSNALKHASASKIEVSIIGKGDKVLVKVADDGIGIPVEIRPRVFEEGFHFGTTGNTGMGLFIIRSIVQRYNGRIWVEDNKPKGTVFYVELNAVGQK